MTNYASLPTLAKITAAPFGLAAIWYFYSHGFTPIRDPESVWQRLWEAEIMKRQVGTSAPVEQEFGNLKLKLDPEFQRPVNWDRVDEFANNWEDQ